jgi:uncharacterized membrane protein
MKTINKIKSLVLAVMLPAVGFCQDQTANESSSYFSNALFLTLLSIIIVLAIVIVAFSSAFKNIADSDFLLNKYNNKKDDSSSTTRNITAIIFLFSSIALMAQETTSVAKADDGLIGGLDQFTFYFMCFVIFIELLVMGLMFYQFNFLVRTNIVAKEGKAKKVESKILMSLTDAVAVEEEEDERCCGILVPLESRDSLLPS